jgi:putative spermidine/putrescine transport system substrate-binding protein
MAQQPQVTVSVFGIGQNDFKRIVYDPFEATCGCKVVVEVGNNADRLARLDARKDSPTVDVALFTEAAALEAARKGLTEQLDIAKLTNHAKLYDFAKDPIGGGMGVGYTFYSTSIVYRSDKMPPVTSWKDLFRPELAKRVALPAINTSQAPLSLMMIETALGGTSPQFSAAIGAVGQDKDRFVTYYATGAQVAQLFQQEEIWAAPVGRFSWAALKKLGLPLAWAVPAEGLTGGVNVMVLVKGTKQRDLAHRLIDFWLSADVQSKLAAALVDSPVNREAKLGDEARALLSDGQDIAQKLKLLAPADQIAHRDAWLSAWNKQVAQ